MNRPAITAFAFTLSLVATLAHACGEGAFNMGQGLRYQGYLAPHRARLLVYDDGAIDRRMLYAGLQKAGHAVTVVHDPASLSRALQHGAYDVVISDREDPATLQSISGAPERPRLLPVVARNRRHAPDVQRFDVYVVDGASIGRYLQVINRLLAARAP
jgi:CheY-like chemotaxis protein